MRDMRNLPGTRDLWHWLRRWRRERFATTLNFEGYNSLEGSANSFVHPVCSPTQNLGGSKKRFVSKLPRSRGLAGQVAQIESWTGKESAEHTSDRRRVRRLDRRRSKIRRVTGISRQRGDSGRTWQR